MILHPIIDLLKRIVVALPDYGGGGGQTLRTTHYHGTLSYQNQVVYSMSIPISDILPTDIVLVTARVSRTGTIADGVITWNDDLIVPSAFNSSATMLTVYLRGASKFGYVSPLYSDGTVAGNFNMVYSVCRQLYNKKNGNEINLTMTINDGQNIVLTPQGYNGRLCSSNVATEYEYDVYIMTYEGNAITK